VGHSSHAFTRKGVRCISLAACRMGAALCEEAEARNIRKHGNNAIRLAQLLAPDVHVPVAPRIADDLDKAPQMAKRSVKMRTSRPEQTTRVSGRDILKCREPDASVVQTFLGDRCAARRAAS
jgi:hypothetical protein